MKTYWQLLTEVTQAVRSRLAKVVPPLLMPREPYPWATPHTGWWHPTKAPVKFAWRVGNYHITQVVKNPAAFDLTKEKIYEILMFPYGDEREMVNSVYERLTLGMKDQESSIEDYLFSKGWVRTKTVGSGKFVSVMLHGVPPYTKRAAELVAIHAYALENQGGKLSLMIDDEKCGLGDCKTKSFISAEKMERYGRGR